jgi:hypothetical protein
MPYLTYSTGYGKHYNSIYPFSIWFTLHDAVTEMREFLIEGRAVKVFSMPINVEHYKVTNYKNKRVIQRK